MKSKSRTAKIEKQAKGIIERIKKTLGEKVKDVKVTHRLTDSPACLVVANMIFLEI